MSAALPPPTLPVSHHPEKRTTVLATRSRRTTRLLLAAPALALLLGAGACSAGGTSLSPDAPSEGSSAAAPKDAAFDAEYHRWELEMAECMRGEGVEVQDPKAGGDGLGDGDGDPAFGEAASSCRKDAEIGDPPVREVSQADKEEQLEAGFESARCLRGKGYDIPDPTLEEPFFFPAEVSSEDVVACDEEAGL